MAQINEIVNQFQVAAVRRIPGFAGMLDSNVQALYTAMLNYAEFVPRVKVVLTMRRVRDLKPGDLIVGRIGGAIKKVSGVSPDAQDGISGRKWRIDFMLDEPNWNREGHDFRYPDFYYLIVKQEQ